MAPARRPNPDRAPAQLARHPPRRSPDRRHVGSCSLFNLVRVDGRAAYAIGIDEPSLLGQDLGKEATRLVLAHAFGPAALHRVDLRVLAHNTRAIGCYRACGFVEEGRERQAALVDGTWHDFVIMGILESDPHPRDRPETARMEETL